MPSTKGTSSKIMAMLVIIAMLVSVFSVMGMTAEEAHAAAKAKKPAKVTGFKVTQKSETVTASWKKAKKVKAGKKKHAVKYQLETTVIDVFGGKKTTKSVLNKTKKSYTGHPGTKYTFRMRAFYTNNKGKKVYGKWTAKKSQTIKNTTTIKVEASRTEQDGNKILAQAHLNGAKSSNYDTVVFEFNGKTQKCGKNDYVIFNDAKGGTIKAYAQYTAKNTKGKTKVIKTPYATCGVKAKSTTDPTGGGGNVVIKDDGKRMYLKNGVEVEGAATKSAANVNNPYLEDFSDIGKENYYDFCPVDGAKLSGTGRENNKFIVKFDNDVKTKYKWYFYPANNKVLVNTLSLEGNNTPVSYGELADSNKNKVVMKTNWQCTDGYMVGFEGNKEVYCKKLGWSTQVNYGPQAPGDVSINGPYYKKCQEVFDEVIYQESKANVQSNSAKKAQQIRNYLQDKTTYAMRGSSMNDLLNIGLYYNNGVESNTSINYINLNTFDYSQVLNLLLGVRGGDCYTFQILETFIAKQIDSGAIVAHLDLSSVYGNNHMAIKASFIDGSSIGLDMSNTKYGFNSAKGTAKDMYNDNSWRTYVKEALGDEACKFWFNF